MPVMAIGNYEFPSSDRVENFHGNLMVHILWEGHLMFSSPVSVPVPPGMPFAAFKDDLLPNLYGKHPSFRDIVWDDVVWTLDGAEFVPDASASLAEQGIGHKSLIRFRTPGQPGLFGAGY